MGKLVMLPVEEVDISSVKYRPEVIKAPHLTGFTLRFFVWLLENPILGPPILSFLKKMNKIPEMMQHTIIPENPMFRPEFPPQEPEPGTVLVQEDNSAISRVESALACLPPYKPSIHWDSDPSHSFFYWTIRDYAHAYQSGRTTPSVVAEHVISVVEDSNNKKPPMTFLISFSADEIRKQAAASTRRFEEGNPLSILDGIFIAIKDDIDLYPHPTRGGTTWYDKVRPVLEDAVCVSRLRSCGVIFVGKANMHELGLGTTGNNPNYGTTRNPHAVDRYTGGSSSGPAAIVAAGVCSAAIGTDGGGSIRIPSSLCGVVGFKTTYGRTWMKGALCDCGTVEVVGPIASSVEDVMLVYAAMLGSSSADRISLNPAPPRLPCLASSENLKILSSLRLGKYTEWFNNVYSTEISSKCEDILHKVTGTYGSQVIEIALPELQEMQNAHILSIGSESLAALNPEIKNGRLAELTHDTRTNLAIFRSFSAAEYVTAQCIRRRIMYYHMEAFKKVDVIVTPTTGCQIGSSYFSFIIFFLFLDNSMTAPVIPPSALNIGESNLEVSGYLMRFILAGNLLGLPAINVPVGYDKNGLPIGLQLIGRPWGEATILRLASAVEELSAELRNRPSTFYDILKDV
ncbi:fatty acid amide hydrolase isoform X1 [Aristolochia californica]|uniref:fatty acid amide hydrolase isoform X1 n=1 Tax=Aristolochia californica TaxID=171875 RepID=UPI0035E28721